ncbi:MAG: hypothetical protein ABFD92_03855 [Planctomycetaceae bacterium]|nr:hypothetical protein [Planctomycetaceae bacterium]
MENDSLFSEGRNLCEVDQAVMAMFQQGRIELGPVFTNERHREVLMQVQPSTFKQLIAAVALCFHSAHRHLRQYCDRRHGREPVGSIRPEIDYILADTYGLALYEEQLIEILAFFDVDEIVARILLMDMREHGPPLIRFPDRGFIRHATSLGLPKDEAAAVFRLVRVWNPMTTSKAVAMRLAVQGYAQACRQERGGLL